MIHPRIHGGSNELTVFLQSQILRNGIDLWQDAVHHYLRRLYSIGDAGLLFPAIGNRSRAAVQIIDLDRGELSSFQHT